MLDWLAAQTSVNATKTFLRFQNHDYSFSYVNKQAGLWAAKLKALGVKQGDVVATLLPNQADCVHLCFAVMRLGAILLPLNTRLTEAELGYQLIKTKAQLLISEAKTFRSVSALKQTLPCYFLDEVDDATLVPILAAEVMLEDAFCIMFTSGTTGKPKGVCLTLKNFFYSANASAYRSGLETDDLWLCAMPLYHVGGLSIILRSCLYGTAVLLHERFDFDDVVGALSDEMQKITLVSLVPTMLFRLLKKEDFRLASCVRLILLGGAAASPNLLSAAQKRDFPVATTYGLTEACSQVATSSLSSKVSVQGFVGKALMFSIIKVIDRYGQELSAGQHGEILVQGPSIMQGYFDDETASRKALQDGWLHTGDIGYLDEQGQLFIEARRSDLIVSGGENIYPREVEAVLEKDESVQNATVIGLQDIEWGQKVVAAIILKDKESNQQTMKTKLERLCKEELAGYKCPRQYFFVDTFPLTASGKVKRHDLKLSLALLNRP